MPIVMTANKKENNSISIINVPPKIIHCIPPLIKVVPGHIEICFSDLDEYSENVESS